MCRAREKKTASKKPQYEYGNIPTFNIIIVTLYGIHLEHLQGTLPRDWNGLKSFFFVVACFIGLFIGWFNTEVDLTSLEPFVTPPYDLMLVCGFFVCQEIDHTDWRIFGRELSNFAQNECKHCQHFVETQKKRKFPGSGSFISFKKHQRADFS